MPRHSRGYNDALHPNELQLRGRLALGGGGYGLFRVVPRSWTHLLATVLDRDVDTQTPVPDGWVGYVNGLVQVLARAHGRDI